MARQLITEIYNIKNGTVTKKDGSQVRIAYIDPQTSEDTYKIKDEIAKRFGAIWLGKYFKGLKAWGWFLNDNGQEVYQNKIKPCLEYLTSIEENPNNEERDVIQIINTLISELDQVPAAVEMSARPAFNKTEIKEKLEQYKRELINIVSDKEFKEKMLPIIKFRNAQGHSYSFANAILFYIQDPESTMIKSKTRWAAMNKTVKPDAPALWGWFPKKSAKLTPEQKEEIKQKFLNFVGKSSEEELTPGQKEELKIRLRPMAKGSSFDIGPYFFDVRFTEQMEGKEDLVGDRNHDLPWYDDNGEVTEETTKLCDAILATIQKANIKVSAVKDLGGARVVSKSGSIDYLEGVPKNIGTFNTLCHEFAHELLHQKYLKNSDTNPNGYGSYFIGKAQGRAVVEQQAELCAWIVCRNFGYDMPTNINYVGLWGLDDKAAPYVFDTVANAATQIIIDLYGQMESQVNESKINFIFEMTGLDVAKMIGCEDVYLKNKERTEEEEETRTAFQESFNMWLGKLNRTQGQRFRL